MTPARSRRPWLRMVCVALGLGLVLAGPAWCQDETMAGDGSGPAIDSGGQMDTGSEPAGGVVGEEPLAQDLANTSSWTDAMGAVSEWVPALTETQAADSLERAASDATSSTGISMDPGDVAAPVLSGRGTAGWSGNGNLQTATDLALDVAKDTIKDAATSVGQTAFRNSTWLSPALKKIGLAAFSISGTVGKVTNPIGLLLGPLEGTTAPDDVLGPDGSPTPAQQALLQSYFEKTKP